MITLLIPCTNMRQGEGNTTERYYGKMAGGLPTRIFCSFRQCMAWHALSQLIGQSKP
jgi:hypothetical protein